MQKRVLNGVPFHLYVMMSTYGTNATVEEEKKRHYNKDGQKKVTTFVYPEVEHNHYCYWDVMDNHNSVRMHPISMEETLMTTHWPNRVFCFLLTLTIVNIQNAGCYFAKLPKIEALQAQNSLPNNLYTTNICQRRSKSTKHQDQIALDVQHGNHPSTTSPHSPHSKIQKFANRQMQIQISEVAVQMQSCSCEELLQMLSRCHLMCQCYAMHHIDSEMQDLLGA